MAAKFKNAPFVFSSCYCKIIVAELFFRVAIIMCIMFQRSIIPLDFELRLKIIGLRLRGSIIGVNYGIEEDTESGELK